MRPTPWLLAEPHRLSLRDQYESHPGDAFGAFAIPHAKTGVKLRCIAVSGEISREDYGHLHAWDHVSVSLPNRIPNWTEMAFVKSIFWGDHETVMQLHVPTSDHINIHPYVLHLWRPLNERIPMPPKLAV